MYLISFANHVMVSPPGDCSRKTAELVYVVCFVHPLVELESMARSLKYPW
jgi:hypothetical protein